MCLYIERTNMLRSSLREQYKLVTLHWQLHCERSCILLCAALDRTTAPENTSDAYRVLFFVKQGEMRNCNPAYAL